MTLVHQLEKAGGESGLATLGIGTVSVTKAVHVDRQGLRCACVGGSNGFTSLVIARSFDAIGIMDARSVKVRA